MFQVVSFVRRSMETCDRLSVICQRLIDKCKELSDDVTCELPQVIDKSNKKPNIQVFG